MSICSGTCRIVVAAQAPYKILDCDNSISQLLEYTAEEVLCRTIRFVFGPETDSVGIISTVKNASFQNSTSLKAALYSKSGKSVPVSLLCHPFELNSFNVCECMIRASGEVVSDSPSCPARQEKLPEATQANETAKPKERTCTQGSFAHEVLDHICLAQYVKPFASTKKFRCFRPQSVLTYYAYCDDFGPMNMSSVARFIQLLDQELEAYPSSKLMFCVDDGRRALTNAVFLLGAYMILKLGMTVEEVSGRFDWLRSSDVEGFRDATFSEADFVLSLKDCWRGLARGLSNGWVGMPASAGGLWGKIDMESFEHLDDPLNGDLNVVVPGEFVAFRGPRDLNNGKLHSDDEGCRHSARCTWRSCSRSLVCRRWCV